MAMILYKKEIINKIAEKTGLKKKDIKEMLTTFGEVICEELKNGNSIVLLNIFKIMPVIKKARNRYIPSHNEMQYEEERMGVKMIPSENLKRMLRD